MGLDIGDYSASYSSFNRLRAQIAEAEGFDLYQMLGYCKHSGHSHPYDVCPEAYRSWDEVSSPLVPLLNHSDCDGALTADECRAMLPRLTEVVAGLAIVGRSRTQADALVDDIRWSAETGRTLTFS